VRVKEGRDGECGNFDAVFEEFLGLHLAKFGGIYG